MVKSINLRENKAQPIYKTKGKMWRAHNLLTVKIKISKRAMGI